MSAAGAAVATAPGQDLDEGGRNRLLRRVDWRLALNGREQPRLLVLGGDPETAAALALVTRPAGDGPADLVLLGFPGEEGLRRARAALAPGGEIACLWDRIRPGAIQLASRRLAGAGFGRVRTLWPAWDAGSEPRFWLPLDSPTALDDFYANRPPDSLRDAVGRRLWRTALAAGAAAPVVLLGQLTDDPPEPDQLDAALPPDGLSYVLHTGGDEADNKVAAIPFPAGASGPAPVLAKFGREARGDAALRGEGALLRRLAGERPDLAGFPRIHAEATRAGGFALVQDAFHGPDLDPADLGTSGPAVTDWLVALAGPAPEPRPAPEWRPRLLEEPLRELETDYGDVFAPELAARARTALAGLGPLPLVWEHRDFGSWNVVLTAEGPAVIDWESAEPEGLPFLDLVYLLTMSALQVEDGFAPGAPAAAIAEAVFDPATEAGRVAAPCLERYGAALGIDPAELPRLRLACWVVQALLVSRYLRGRGPRPLDATRDLFVKLAGAAVEVIEA
jgi:hypothetical protein